MAAAGASSLPSGRRIWIGSIVVDCRELERMIAFWSEALHYVPRDPPQPDGVVLRDPEGRGPNLNLSLTDEAPPAGYRIHLDLYATDPEAEVARLVGLGATVVHRPRPGEDFLTLADPDGNIFDVVDKAGPGGAPGGVFGRSP